MITFYRTRDCPGCGAVEDTLGELVLAHSVIIVKNRQDLRTKFGQDAKVPLLVDGDERFEGIKAIIEHLEQMAEFKKLWEKYQSDACYCDENQ